MDQLLAKSPRQLMDSDSQRAAPPALVVDLDGTLVRGDLTFEMLALCLRWRPVLFIPVMVQFCFDKAGAKNRLAVQFADKVDLATLPYEPAVMALIEEAQSQDRTVALVSGSDHTLVSRIAARFGIQHVKGTEAGVNLIAEQKSLYLRQAFGDQFEYVGNARADYPVWRAGQGGYGVRAPRRAYCLMRSDGSKVVVTPLGETGRLFASLLSSLRPHQWMKNLLLFIVPAIQIMSVSALDVVALISAFICFSALTSSTYLLNDVLDIPDDRRHKTKAERAIASGRLSIGLAACVALGLLLFSLVCSFLISPVFAAISLLYLAVTLAYSFHLKRVAVLDVFTLAGLFSIRVIAGAYLIGFPPSGWLMTFTGAFFLSLAIGKRYVEVKRHVSTAAVAGRGYVNVDEAPLLIAGTAIGAMSVLALLIYGLSAPVTVFQSEAVVLCGAALLMAWVLRFWLLAGRGEVSDDPVEYAIKDRTSVLLLTFTAFIIAGDLTGPMWQSLF